MLGKLVGINHVAARLGHLVHTKVEPRVTKYLFGERNIHCHQEDRPIDGVEAQNVLTDDVNVSRPIFFEVLALLFKALVGVKANGGNVVGQRVKPNVNHVLVVKVNGNTPLKGGTGNAKILQTCLEEVVYHFLFAKLGLNEIGVFLDVLHQTVGIFAHFEEVSFFFCLRELATAVGALAVSGLCVGKEGLAGSAVPTLVFALVNVALLVKFLKDLLYSRLVIIVGGADEIIVANVHFVPQLANFAGYTVNVSLGGNACILGEVFNFLTVLVGSGTKEYVLAAHTLIASNCVRHNSLIGVAKVGLARSVGNSGCQIEFFTHSLKFPFCFQACEWAGGDR